ncbi:MAG: thioredoxin [Fuerstiella sp.]
MTKPETRPAKSMNNHYLMLTLMFSFTISGCTQASQWLSENQLKKRHTLAENSQDDSQPDSTEISVAKTEDETKRANTFLTNFEQPATSKKRPSDREAAATTLASSSHKMHTAKMHTPQKPDSATPRKSLTTLAKGESLDKKLKQAPGVVIVDFYADWCGPCRRQATILHSMESKAAENNATMIKVNIDQHRQLAQKYKVSSLPTLIVIKQGAEVSRQVGLANQAKITSLIQL